jgi:hypothetical protein
LNNSFFSLINVKLKNEVDEVFMKDIYNDLKKDMIIDLMNEYAIYDKLYAQEVSQQQLDFINTEICPLFIGGNWFHNLIKKKYHKQYKTKKDAFNSYYRTVNNFEADKYFLDTVSGQWMVRFAITGESFAYN